MSKKATQTSDEVLDGSAVETQEAQQPSPYDDLLKNGTGMLTAKTREELAELVDNIPADTKYCVGAVGRNRMVPVFPVIDQIENLRCIPVGPNGIRSCLRIIVGVLAFIETSVQIRLT
jgi:hypothetical protein